MKSFALMLVLAVSAIQLRADELYIVPIYGQNLRGSTAVWTSGVLLNNPHPEAVEVEVAGAYPAMEKGCRPCPSSQRWTLAPYESLLLPPIAGPTGLLQLGAFSLRAKRPIDVDSVVQGLSVIEHDATPFVIQPIEAGRRWIPPNVPAYLPRVSTGASGTPINVFLVNPNDTEIRVDYSVDPTPTLRLDQSVKVPPKSTLLLPVLPGCTHDGHGCFGAHPVASSGFRIGVRGSGEFYASASVPALIPHKAGISTPLFIGPVF